VKRVPILCAGALSAFAACVHAPAGGAEAFRGSRVDWKVTDLSGAPFDLASLRGQVVVIDFWATWCEPCRASMPHHESLHRKFGDKGLRVIGISMDEDARMVEPFAREVGVTFTLLWDKGGAETARRIGLQRIPTTLVLGRDGTALSVYEGWFPSTAGKIEQDVVQALAAEGAETAQPRATAK
jgi:thiol-disulfide isomerase/thioredoxin